MKPMKAEKKTSAARSASSTTVKLEPALVSQANLQTAQTMLKDREERKRQASNMSYALKKTARKTITTTLLWLGERNT